MRAHKMKYSPGIWLLTAILLPLSAQVPMADEDAIAAAARSAGSASLDVVERYEATSAFTGTEAVRTLPYVSQPFADLAIRLLRLAGVTELTESNSEIRIIIEASGTTEAVLYDTSIGGQRIRDTTFRSANLAGTIRIETHAGVVERTFAASIPAPFDFMVTFGYDPYREPANAPFREAFEAPGGYADAIAMLLSELFGSGLLDRALSDGDPLVRRAAELARQH